MKKLKEKIRSIDLRKHVSDKQDTAECAYYIRINGKFSLKLYSCKKLRDATFENQKIGFKKGIGPKAFMKVKVGEYFGYVTEHANTRKLTEKELRYLVNKIYEDTSWDDCDLDRYTNVGILRDKPVIIDFGPMTLGYEYESE